MRSKSSDLKRNGLRVEGIRDMGHSLGAIVVGDEFSILPRLEQETCSADNQVPSNVCMLSPVRR